MGICRSRRSWLRTPGCLGSHPAHAEAHAQSRYSPPENVHCGRVVLQGDQPASAQTSSSATRPWEAVAMRVWLQKPPRWRSVLPLTCAGPGPACSSGWPAVQRGPSLCYCTHAAHGRAGAPPPPPHTAPRTTRRDIHDHCAFPTRWIQVGRSREISNCRPHGCRGQFLSDMPPLGQGAPCPQPHLSSAEGGLQSATRKLLHLSNHT